MHDPSDPVAQVFDAVADTYDNVGVDFFGPIARGLVRALEPAPGERALDVGCGRGAVLFPLAEAVAPGGTVTAIDLAPRMVAATATDVAASGLDPDRVTVDVRHGDAMAPTSPRHRWTSSRPRWCCSSCPTRPQPWRRGGTSWSRAGAWASRPSAPTPRPGTPSTRSSPPTSHDLPDPRNMGPGSPFATDAGTERLLEGAGFTAVGTTSQTIAVRFDDADQWHRWSWSVGQRRMWLLVPEEERSAVRARAAAHLETTRDEHGHIGFDQVVRYTLARR